MGEEEVHFNLKKILKQYGSENTNCKTVETIVPISPELIFDCNFQNSINENEMNFQYLDDLDCEWLNSSFDLKETIFSLNENCPKKCSNEEKVEETKTSSKGLTLKELPSHLKHAFLEPEKARHVVISVALTDHEEQKLLEILRKYKQAIALR